MGNLDYTSTISMVSSTLSVAFPIALILWIVKEIIGLFTSFVFGRKVDL